MNLTLEDLEKVMNTTGATYAAAKETLNQTNGDVDEAIKLLQSPAPEESFDDNIKETMDKLKKKVNQGGVERIQIKKGDEIVLNVPVGVGVLGGILGIAAAPWAMIAGALLAFGLGCKLEVVKKDGTIDEVN